MRYRKVITGCLSSRCLTLFIFVAIILLTLFGVFSEHGLKIMTSIGSESPGHWLFREKEHPGQQNVKKVPSPFPVELTKVNLAVVACGQKRNVVENVINLIKSAILFSQDVDLQIFVFIDGETDVNQTETMSHKLQKYEKTAKSLGFIFNYKIMDSWFPKNDLVDWRNFYMSCTTQRLFLPSILNTTDAVLYLDADTIFVSSVKDAWNTFRQMNSQQIAGMINEHEPPADGYYNVHSKIPFYGPRGLNGGVSFMNLTRMRRVGFEQKINLIYDKYNEFLKYADQDLMNIFFSFNPHLMLSVSCAFNYRKGHCICDYPDTGSCQCKDAEKTGIAITHGNIWGYEKLPLIIIYEHFSEYNLKTGSPFSLYEKITADLELYPPTTNNACLEPNIKRRLLIRFKLYLDELRRT